jgi:gamma-glutamylputrescine oxidase
MRSYWHATTAGEPFAGDVLPREADVAVVGAGLLGAATVYWLARAGQAPVLIEQAGPAHGASGRNGGFVVAGTAEPYQRAIARLGRKDARAVWALTLENRVLLREALLAEGIACDYREVGHLHLALGEAQLAELAEEAEALRADGFEAALLARDAVQELVGTPLGPEIVGAAYASADALLHSAHLVRGLLQAARRHGARVCLETTLHALAPEAGGLRLTTSGGELRAGRAVLAINAWSATLVPALRDLIKPVRGQILAFAPAPAVFRCGMGAALTPTGEYWQQTPDGTIVLGGGRALAPNRDEGLLDDGLTPEVQAVLEAALPRLFPRLGPLRVARRWSGPMAFTPDRLPIADAVPGLPNAWLVGGFSGHGMPFGMPLGRLIAQAVTSGAPPAELQPFRIGRPSLAEESPPLL